MKNRKSSLFLVTLMILSMLGAAFVTVPSVSAYTVTIDGDPSDWQEDTTAQGVNTFQEYVDMAKWPYPKSYVWKDELDDDVGDGDYEYPCNVELNPGGLNRTVDLLEARITWNATHLLMLFRMADVENPWGSATGFSGMMILVLIDQDHTVGSGNTYIPSYADGDVIGEKAWEYAIKLKGWNEVWNQTGTVPEIIDYDGGAYGGTTEKPQPYPGFGVMGDNVTECIEVAVPLEIIGPVCSKQWNFMIFTGHEDSGNFREVQTDPCDWTPGGKGPSDFDAFDAAFYSSKAIQTADWADDIIGNEVYGEGWQEVCFINYQHGELYVGWSPDPDNLTLVNCTELGPPCTNFTVYIKTRNITDLWGMSFWMNFDPAILQCTGVRYGTSWGVVNVDYLVPPVTPILNNTTGEIGRYDAARMSAAVAANATLYEVDFHVIGTLAVLEDTILQIYCKPIEMLDGNLNPICPKIINGVLHGPEPGPPEGPTAVLMESLGPYYEGDDVDFWSDSEPGFNGTHTIPLAFAILTITECDLGTIVFGPSVYNTSVPWTWTWTWPEACKDYHINLTVITESDPILVGQGLTKDTVVVTKHPFEKALIFIDCYTNKARRCGYEAKYIGLGWNQSADAYMLDELVTLHAWVVYNNNPMQARLVSFEVYDAEGQLYLVKQNMTDEEGHTWISFRIPTECMNYSRVFGKWYCFQKVLLCDEYYNDTLWWDVGWIIELQSVVVEAERGGIWQPVEDVSMDEHIGVWIELKNRAMNPRTIVISVVVFDDNDVVVIQHLTKKTIPGGEFCNPYHMGIEIICMTFPKWTYPGTGKVEVSAWFNDLPTGCGHCCCPDVEDVFVITAPEPTPPDP